MIAVLFAALLHASWNFLVKQNEDKVVSVTAIIIGHAPLAFVAIILVPLPEWEAIPYLIAGTLLHLGYQFFLMNAYRIGDLTQVYPLARGVAPLMVTGVSLLFLGVVLSLPQAGGILLIGIGLMSLALVRRSGGLRNPKAALAALATGCFIASYSLVDGMGARAAGTALGYYSWLTVFNGLTLSAIMIRTRPGLLKRVVVDNWKLTYTGGSAAFIAYAIVTWGFTQAPIALVTALRETSIIFALLLGVLVLKERMDLAKLLATILTITGILVLRLA